MMEAYEALLKTEQEIEQLRCTLSSTHASLDLAQHQCVLDKNELNQTKQNLNQTELLLRQSQQTIVSLTNDRKSLLQEIKATKDVLMTSLKNVQELEVESRKVPRLEARIDDLEKYHLLLPRAFLMTVSCCTHLRRMIQILAEK